LIAEVGGHVASGMGVTTMALVPVMTEAAEIHAVLHCLVYTPSTPLKSVGRPILLDMIACDFPELKLIG
jgi:hypothetical protein